MNWEQLWLELSTQLLLPYLRLLLSRIWSCPTQRCTLSSCLDSSWSPSRWETHSRTCRLRSIDQHISLLLLECLCCQLKPAAVRLRSSWPQLLPMCGRESEIVIDSYEGRGWLSVRWTRGGGCLRSRGRKWILWWLWERARLLCLWQLPPLNLSGYYPTAINR